MVVWLLLEDDITLERSRVTTSISLFTMKLATQPSADRLCDTRPIEIAQ